MSDQDKTLEHYQSVLSEATARNQVDGLIAAMYSAYMRGWDALGDTPFTFYEFESRAREMLNDYLVKVPENRVMPENNLTKVPVSGVITSPSGSVEVVPPSLDNSGLQRDFSHAVPASILEDAEIVLTGIPELEPDGMGNWMRGGPKRNKWLQSCNRIAEYIRTLK